MAARDAVELIREFDLLARSIDSGPRVLVHRDFHAGNLMIRRDGTLAMVDVDDLCVGNPFYDLATLLIDGYRPVDLGLVDAVVERHHVLASTALFDVPDLDDWRRGFDRQAVARCLKAAGRFCWLAEVSDRREYLDGLHLVRAAAAAIFARRAELAPLRDLLARRDSAFTGGIAAGRSAVRARRGFSRSKTSTCSADSPAARSRGTNFASADRNRLRHRT